MHHVVGSSDGHADLDGQAAPPAWLRSMLRRLVAATAKGPRISHRAREAAELRQWATRVQHTDPRYAEDLFAAADRHEGMRS
jgi:hypothetical protein